jgi:hypothetical protein
VCGARDGGRGKFKTQNSKSKSQTNLKSKRLNFKPFEKFEFGAFEFV